MPAGLAPATARTGSRSAWLGSFLALRDRLLANPRFQRWAAGFVLTRPVARRRSRDLFDLCAGFVYSQILFACVRLRLFEILAEGPQTVPELSRRLSLKTDATARLLAAAVALRLVERRGRDSFGLGVLGAALLGNPAVAAMIEHHTMLYADLHDPVGLLRGTPQTELSRYWPYAGGDAPGGLSATQIGPYTRLMAESQALIAEDILEAHPLRRHRCLLDVGGGDGSFLVAAGERARALRLVLFDLPAVAAQARGRFAAHGLADRATAIGGDFLSEPLPREADIVSLVRVLHDHDDATVVSLLRAVRLALPPDGTLLIAEPMSGTRGAEPIGDAYFGFYLLAMGRGRPRSPQELTGLLATAGFGRVRMPATRRPLLTRVLLARPA